MLAVTGCAGRPKTVTLSSGANASAYARIGDTIATVSESVGLTVTDDKNSEGSQQNLQRLLDKQVDFALVQLDVAGEAMKAGEVVAVAMLTEEYLHLISRRGTGIQNFAQLQDQVVNIGPLGSGINFTAQRIFQTTDLKIEAQALSETETDSGDLVGGKTDALVYVGPLKASTQVRQKITALSGLRFLALDNSFINYLTLQFPESYRKTAIPQGTYKPLPALPSRDVLTISTGGALLTRPDVPKETVALMTWGIASHSRQFASFYPKLAEENGNVNLYEGLLYLHPGALQAYQTGDPRIAWLRYLQGNKPLQAASIMLISTTTIGFLIQGWRRRKINKILHAHRQAIADLREQMTTEPKQALQNAEGLQQDYRLMLIEGTLGTDLYSQIDERNEIFIQRCRRELNRQHQGDIDQIVEHLSELQENLLTRREQTLGEIQQCQQTYREMLLSGRLDFSSYLSLYQMQLLMMTLVQFSRHSTAESSYRVV